MEVVLLMRLGFWEGRLGLWQCGVELAGKHGGGECEESGVVETVRHALLQCRLGSDEVPVL